ncbi:hypothetical protein K431DRAFT_348579 [Polychaeton citri CBS 116435]|uniref:Transmembrane protein n=1 Tax=Polychaeton citri CBS 116435 TaxID=1314669 RepID=A0A9P4Q338_9PEZI|nr:hypothetical protein K431DRAFT_348579 [Polychaeton citri CBS 116435]
MPSKKSQHLPHIREANASVGHTDGYVPIFPGLSLDFRVTFRNLKERFWVLVIVSLSSSAVALPLILALPFILDFSRSGSSLSVTLSSSDAVLSGEDDLDEVIALLPHDSDLLQSVAGGENDANIEKFVNAADVLDNVQIEPKDVKSFKADRKVRGTPEIRADFEGTPEHSCLREVLRVKYGCEKPVHYPGYAMLEDHETFRFVDPQPYGNATKMTIVKKSAAAKDEEEEEEEEGEDDAEGRPTNVASLVRQSSTFLSARMASQEELNEQVTYNASSANAIVDAAAQEVQRSIAAQDNLMMTDYENALTMLLNVRERPSAAANASHDEIVSVHVHRHKYLTIGGTKFERDLAIVFAGIIGGFHQTLPFVLLVEAVLRGMWRAPVRRCAETDSVLKPLFDEATLFCSGTALNACVTRCTTASISLSAQDIGNKWFPRLRAFNPRCANENCNRNLPRGEDLDDHTIRGLFSVGTRQARIGHRCIRDMISQNRDFGYLCLYSILMRSRMQGSSGQARNSRLLVKAVMASPARYIVLSVHLSY